MLCLSLMLALAFTSVAEAKPKLVLFSVGVNYQAVKDKKEDVFAEEAMHLENGIEKQCDSLYDVKKKYLHSEKATRQNCLNGLKWVADTAQEGDIAIVYIGSHGGGGVNGDYSFYPATGSISSKEIIGCLENVKCPLFLLVDTCHAEAMIIDWWDCEDSVSILSACKADQTAYVWNFVKPFVKALKEADYNRDKVVDISEIETYVINHTKDQNPVASSGEPDTPISQTEGRYLIPFIEGIKYDFRIFEGSHQGNWQAPLPSGAGVGGSSTNPIEIHVKEAKHQPRNSRETLYLLGLGGQKAILDYRRSSPRMQEVETHGR